MKGRIDVSLNDRGRIILIASALILSLNIITILYIANRGAILLSFAILSILLSDWIILRLRLTTLEKLDIKRIFDKNTYDNTPLEVVLRITNNSLFGLYSMELDDRYPSTTKIVEGKNRGVISLPPKSSVEVKYTLDVEAVGRHRFGNLFIRMQDILGLFTIKAEFEDITENEIYCSANIPAVDIREMMKKGLKILSGPWTSKKIGFSMEFKEIREYRPGDEIKRVDWKASARINKLMIREFEAEAQTDIVIILDLSRNMFLGELGIRKYDYSTRTIAFIVNYAIRNRDRIGMLLIQPDKYNVIPLQPASRQTYRAIMKYLSSIDVDRIPERYTLSSIPFGRILSRLGIKGKTLFIAISDLEEEARASLLLSSLKTLRMARHEVVLLSPLTHLFEIRMVKGVDMALYRVEAYKSMKERKKIESQLKKLGIPVVNVGPDDLIPIVLAKLEEFRRVTPT